MDRVLERARAKRRWVVCWIEKDEVKMGIVRMGCVLKKILPKEESLLQENIFPGRNILLREKWSLQRLRIARKSAVQKGLMMFLAACVILLGLLTLCAFTASDGEYAVSVDMSGGSGKAAVTSPTILRVVDRTPYAQIQWSSANYDYMIVDGKTYLNESEKGRNSVFEIPVLCWDEPMEVIADTTAMGGHHEIRYQLVFYSDSVGSKSELPQEAAKRVLLVAAVIIVVGGVLNYFVKKYIYH